MKTTLGSLRMTKSAVAAARTHPVQVAALDHVVLRVADLDRSTAFYRDVLGCAVEKWQPEFGLLQLRAGLALIDLVTLDGPIGREGGACAWSALTRPRCAPIWPDTRSQPAQPSGAMAPKATALRSTSGIRTATPSS
jgi:catechol 2,3-dioxygenase-like lactoylglutathione lyase family enzyme